VSYAKTLSWVQAQKHLQRENRLRFVWNEKHFVAWATVRWGGDWNGPKKRMPLNDLELYYRSSRDELKAIRRREQVEGQRRSWKMCWDWEPTVGGRAEVSTWAEVVGGGKADGQSGWTGAEVVVEEVSDEGETFIVRVDYLPGTVGWCRRQNGTRLKVDITALWAPVHVLHEQVVACREGRTLKSNGDWDEEADETKMAAYRPKPARKALIPADDGGQYLLPWGAVA